MERTVVDGPMGAVDPAALRSSPHLRREEPGDG